MHHVNVKILMLKYYNRRPSMCWFGVITNNLLHPSYAKGGASLYLPEEAQVLRCIPTQLIALLIFHDSTVQLINQYSRWPAE